MTESDDWRRRPPVRENTQERSNGSNRTRERSREDERLSNMPSTSRKKTLIGHYLPLGMASYVLGTFHGIKYIFVASSVKAIPAWLSNSEATFPAGTGLFIAMGIDMMQFALSYFVDPFGFGKFFSLSWKKKMLFFILWGLWMLEAGAVFLFMANTQIGDIGTMYEVAMNNWTAKIFIDPSTWRTFMSSALSTLMALLTLLLVVLFTLPEFIQRSIVEGVSDEDYDFVYTIIYAIGLGLMLLYRWQTVGLIA